MSTALENTPLCYAMLYQYSGNFPFAQYSVVKSVAIKRNKPILAQYAIAKAADSSGKSKSTEIKQRFTWRTNILTVATANNKILAAFE